MRRLMIWGAVAVGVLVLVGLIFAQLKTGSAAPASTAKAFDGWWWFTFAVLIVLAVAAAFDKGGAPAKLALGILVGVFLLKFISGFVFGESSTLVTKKLQKNAVDYVLSEQSTAPASTPKRKAADADTAVASTSTTETPVLGQPFTTTVNPTSKEWSKWVRVMAGQCISAPSVEAENAQVLLTDDGTPLDWNVHQDMKKRGEAGNFRWVRFRSDGTQTTIPYGIRTC